MKRNRGNKYLILRERRLCEKVTYFMILCDSLEKQTMEKVKILVFARGWREGRMMGRHSTEEFSCSETILHDRYYNG